MTHLYALDLRPYQSGRWRELLPVLSEERRQRALSCRFDADRARVTGAGWLLQYALEQAGIPASSQRFTQNPWGKPLLAENSTIHFSLSHSGPWAVCAVSGEPVGVDVELPRCTLPVAQRYFQPVELEGLETLDRYSQMDQLNRIWTAKEAFLKALGRGLTVPLNSFTIVLSPQQASLRQDHSPLPYRLHEYHPDICRICLCTTDDRPELQFVTP